jgi:NAD(P)-dependent dehydrogenase (short-subunit alcohol dehydrogenase family)
MPGMPGEPGQDQPAGPAAPGRSRAGPVAVVTGGSAGLGLAIAAARLAARTGATVRGRARGVTDGRAAGALTEQVLAGHGRLDVPVTSAGIQARGTVDQLPVADLRACVEDGAAGTWLACRAAAPMRAAGYGRIVTLASAPGLAGAAARSGSAASNGAVARLTRSLAAGLAGTALLLTDPASSYLTGALVPVDGGRTARRTRQTPQPPAVPINSSS